MCEVECVDDWLAHIRVWQSWERSEPCVDRIDRLSDRDIAPTINDAFNFADHLICKK